MILTIETSTDIATLGLFDYENELINSISYEYRNDMAKEMFTRLDALMSGKSIHDIKLILVTLGPGSFTGVRIGVITAKMLAAELNIPIIGVSALTALAAKQKDTDNIVMPIINARRKELYFKLCSNGNDVLTETAGNEEVLRKVLSKYSNDKIVVIGILENLPEDLNALLSEYQVIQNEITPEHILSACSERIATKDFDDPLTLAPIYLRSATDR